MNFLFTHSYLRVTALAVLPLFVFFFITSSFSSSLVHADEVSEQTLEEAAGHIKEGIGLYKASDFNSAIVALNRGLKILEKSINQMKAQKDLINAHLHLGLAYIGVNNNAEAKKQFTEIFALDPQYSIDQSSYSGKVVSTFNEAKVQYLSTMVEEKREDVARTEEATSEKTSETQDEKKPLYKKWWFWTLVAAGGIGIAAASAKDEKKEEATEPEPLFEDDFEDGNYNGWHPLHHPEHWMVVDGELAHIPSDDYIIDEIEAGDPNWRIGTYEVTMGDFVGDLGDYEIYIVFGKRNADNYYYVTFNYGDLCLHQVINGDDEALDSIGFALSPGSYYNIRIEIGAQTILVFVDNNLRLQYSAAVQVVGLIGLGALHTCYVAFDDVFVWPYEETSMSQRRGKLLRSHKIHSRTTRPVLQPKSISTR